MTANHVVRALGLAVLLLATTVQAGGALSLAATSATASSGPAGVDAAFDHADALLAAHVAGSASVAEGLALQRVNLATARRVLAASGDDDAARALAIAEIGIASKQGLVGDRFDLTMGPLLEAQAQHVRTARDVLDALAADGSGLERALRVAALASQRDAAHHGVDVIPPALVPTHARPSDAATALAHAHGLSLSAADVAALAAWDDHAQAAGLARIIDAFAAFERAVADDDAGAVLGARDDLVQAMGGLVPRKAAAACEPAAIPVDEAVPTALITVDALGCDATYTRDAVLSIDLGGDDVYLNNAGGNGYRPDPCLETSPHPAAALVDLSGDDAYVSGRACGVNGGAIGGAAVLVDAAGHDEYLAGRLGTNGGGHAGRGLLVDASGDDRYEATGIWGTNGGGFVGEGVLIDVAGDDTYRANASGTNGGAEFGTGFLVDGDGNDAYLGGSRATNGGAYVGAAFLLDAGAGADAYIAAVGDYGDSVAKNGGGGHAGAAFLFDGGGPDVYVGGDSGTNGGGWFGVGLLVDAGGDDSYTAGQDGVNGAGWALVPTSRPIFSAEELVSPVGIGMLVDLSGDDAYAADKFGANGGCYIGSSFFVDAGGDDDFVAQDGGGVNGGGGGKIFGGCTAFFLNDGGDDAYTTHYGGDRQTNSPRTNQFKGGRGANGGVGGVGGVAFFLDTGGDDSYVAWDEGVNGGATQGVALLLDVSGNDTYTGRRGAVNGGAYGAGAGFLVDLGGDDRYVAGHQGVNGGSVDVGGSGLLLDEGGRDEYEDAEGGSGTDVTVVPKGAGAQVDL